MAARHVSRAVERFGGRPLPIRGQIREWATSAHAFGGWYTIGTIEVFVGQCCACPIARDLFEATSHILHGGHRAVDGHLLLHSLALAIVEEAIGGGRTGQCILPGRQSSLIVVAQLCAGLSARTGGCVAGGAAGPIPYCVILGHIGRPASDTGDRVKMGLSP